ncbi:probable transcriptional regulatory protein MMOB1910 [Lepeophtheirus salmonis]|uniref:probable transcriptional regulatory protein MMOB1910 n=1 Tax=Lepeophtheirus salmonis TaxID=72036 RepID=UPI001AE2CC6C|nr:probable transcriptional regulatory protein MMOB1910 [Lepeophtheirus salmonis]
MEPPTQFRHHHSSINYCLELSTQPGLSIMMILSRCLRPMRGLSTPCWSIPFVRQKGHSKWQNIKNTKEAKDIAKGVVAGRHCAQMRFAISSNGQEKDPKRNSHLAKAIKTALGEGVPKVTIENVLKSYGKAAEKEMEFIVRAPGSVRLAIITHYSSKSSFLNGASAILKKNGASIEPTASLKSFFEKKGVIVVKGPSSLESAEEVAIEVDAEEVTQIHEDLYQYISDPLMFPQVRDKILRKFPSSDYIYSEVAFLPLQTVSVGARELELVNKIKTNLNEKQEVISIHDNIVENES